MIVANLESYAGAIRGQIAGTYYTVKAIPSHWLDHLSMCELTTESADRLHWQAPS
jgi:ADP-ribosylglycohydrolase